MNMATAPTYKYTVIDPPLVHDGDTVTVVIDLGFSLFHTLHIRMAGINSPELSTPEGIVARDALIAFVNSYGLSNGWTAQTYKTGQEKYGRWLATLYTPVGISVNQWMLDNGYAVVMK